jgi:type II restriction/modification system DNA methylase subunit YeeA
MTPAEFKKKWARYSGKETAAYQEHFNDLCALLGQPSPAAADPTGSESFCFQKRVVKDAELFALEDSSRVAEEQETEQERGFADVWKKDCFAWEYKGKKKNLDAAYQQLLRYRESLLNPPLLIVCDFDRYVIRTNFNGTVQETHEFTNANIDSTHTLNLLRAAFTDPNFLKPQRTTDEVTEKLAQHIGEVARSLQERESVELIDAKSRRELAVAQRKNLRIARFLNRIVFCFFAEDTGLLPKHVVTGIFKSGVNDPVHFSEVLEDLFQTMATGGTFGQHKIRHFNGHLFENATVFELTEEEIGKLAVAGESDWQFIQPSIMGNLFERGLDPDQRTQLGAHYTSEEDIKTLVEPVLMAPLRREWSEIKGELAPAFVRGEGKAADRKKLTNFHDKLAAITVLDPACGSGNFLYVSLQLLLDLEKEVVTSATQLGFKLESRVSVQQLKAIELNAYAFELAQVAVQIGYLKWRRDNGFPNEREPVLQNLESFQNEDALLVPHFRSKPKSLKEAQAGEHASDDALKFYTEREWPKCDIIVSNPPFLGGKFLRRELGDEYVDAIFDNYTDRVEPQADLCCYWFEKARDLIERDDCKRAGLLATQGIRGGANRETLKRIKNTGDIFFAISDREWILAGANVHVSMIGFDDVSEKTRMLDGRPVGGINSNLTATGADITTAHQLTANSGIAFMGDTKGGAFAVAEDQALKMLSAPNPHGRPNSDVILPWINGLDVTRRLRHMFIIDFGAERAEGECAKYEGPFLHLLLRVKDERVKNKRALYAKYWWRHVEPRPGMLAALRALPRFLTTVAVSKHRLFSWMEAPTLPDHQLFAFARDDDYFFGVLHSRLHEVWALKLGTRLETRPRYTPTTCFETFPFPQPNEQQTAEIAAAAKELNEMRENWLNPPEWTTTRVLEFPGSIDGPWSRYIDGGTTPVSSQNLERDSARPSTGTVRYPRIEPRDEECAKKLTKRTLTNLYNERPAWLANAHDKLDAAVGAAYGFADNLTAEQILEKLLALNLERAAAERKSAAAPKKHTSRARTSKEMI